MRVHAPAAPRVTVLISRRRGKASQRSLAACLGSTRIGAHADVIARSCSALVSAWAMALRQTNVLRAQKWFKELRGVAHRTWLDDGGARLGAKHALDELDQPCAKKWLHQARGAERLGVLEELLAPGDENHRHPRKRGIGDQR